MTAIELIAAERTRQIEVEKYSAEHDDEHGDVSLISASVAYSQAAYNQSMFGSRADLDHIRVMYWPWDRRSWKPKDRRSNLVKSAALIAAEIDRDIRLNG